MITIELTDTTGVLLAEIENRRFKRNDIALTYFLALASSEETDWKKILNGNLMADGRIVADIELGGRNGRKSSMR